MSNQWYYMLGGKQCGPIALDELKKLIDAGHLRATDEVWREGTPDWTTVARVATLNPIETRIQNAPLRMADDLARLNRAAPRMSCRDVARLSALPGHVLGFLIGINSVAAGFPTHDTIKVGLIAAAIGGLAMALLGAIICALSRQVASNADVAR